MSDSLAVCPCVKRAPQDVPYLRCPADSDAGGWRRSICLLCGHDWDPWQTSYPEQHRLVPPEAAAAFRLGGIPAVCSLMHEVLHEVLNSDKGGEWWIRLEQRL